MPAHNEEKNIEPVVNAAYKTLKELGVTGEIVVTNDGSTDNTLKVLIDLQKRIPILKIVNQKQGGYGNAMNAAIKNTIGKYIATIDSDGQFDITELPKLYNKIKEGFDLVTGYRIKKKDSLLKVIGDRVLKIIVCFFFSLPYTDTNCAFKVIKADVLKSLHLESNGFSYPTELLIKAQQKGINSVELPVTHNYRQEGTSNVKVLKTAINMLRFLFYLRLKINLYKANIIHTL